MTKTIIFVIFTDNKTIVMWRNKCISRFDTTQSRRSVVAHCPSLDRDAILALFYFGQTILSVLNFKTYFSFLSFQLFQPFLCLRYPSSVYLSVALAPNYIFLRRPMLLHLLYYHRRCFMSFLVGCSRMFFQNI